MIQKISNHHHPSSSSVVNIIHYIQKKKIKIYTSYSPAKSILHVYTIIECRQCCILSSTCIRNASLKQLWVHNSVTPWLLTSGHLKIRYLTPEDFFHTLDRHFFHIHTYRCIYIYIFLNHLLLTNFTKKVQFEISKGMLVLDERHERKVYWPYNTVYNIVYNIVYNPASIKYIPFLFLLALALLPVRQGGQGVDIQITLEMSNKLCNFFNKSLKSGICQKKIFEPKKSQYIS